MHEALEHRGQRGQRGMVDRGELLPLLLVQAVVHGDVQRHEGHVPRSGEHLGGRLGVVRDVGFGDRSAVAGDQGGAAHDGDAGDQPGQGGVLPPSVAPQINQPKGCILGEEGRAWIAGGWSA
jgi:hypothetical protein